MDSPQPKPGQIITFYSYKGGTGRSMAVANCAYWLVKRFPGVAGRVLVMDWDLEAPGLHRYFAEVTERSENQQRPGVIDYFASIEKRLEADPQLYERLEEEDEPSAFEQQFPLDDHVIRDVVPGVDFVKAGRFDAAYSQLISTFNWVEFYRRYGTIFSLFRDLLLRRYQFCLIDSRTGLNDISGICTMLLPEKLVTVFTPNRQNITGVLELVARAAEYRLGSSDLRTLSIFPLPSRIENAEFELSQTWHTRYQHDFESTLKAIYKLDACDLAKYFDDVQLPHASFYAYGEEIALLKEERSGALSLSRAYEVFFSKLVEQDFAWDRKPLVPDPMSEPAGIRAAPVEPGAAGHAEIFISYANIDDLSATEQKGWVTSLHRALSVRLAQLLGEEVRIWRDPKLRGNDVFDESLVNRLSTVDLFVAVITPRYVKSDWCLRELAEFCRRHAELGDHDFGSRVFKVIKTPTARELLTGSGTLTENIGAETVSELLDRKVGYEFFRVSPDGKTREFDEIFGPESQRDFWMRLDDLAHDIVNMLQKVRMGDTSAAAPAASAARTDVYLAETTPDLAFQRDNIRRELQQSGYRVVPDRPLPTEARALRETIQKHLETSRLSIHLIGAQYGLIPDGDTQSTVEIQAGLAAERSGFSRIIWMPVGLQPEDPQQREFVARLRRGVPTPHAADLHDELLESPLQSLKMVLQDTLTRAPGTRPALAASDVLRIYLVCDSQDVESVRPLEDALFEAGYEVILPVFEGVAAEIAEAHRENLLLCDAVLIYYGRGSVLWLRTKMREVTKAAGWGRAQPILAKAVVIGTPDSEEKARFRTHDALVIKATGALSPSALQPFLSLMQGLRPKNETRIP